MLSVTSNGKFHGTIAPTTPTASFHTPRRLVMPIMSPSGSVALPLERVDHLGRPQQRVLQRRVELGRVGEETGRADLGDQLLAQLLALALDGGLQLQQALLAELRWLVDQSVSSKARRAAAIAVCMSAFDASATWPSTSSVAGLMLSNRLPEPGFDELAVDEHAGLAREQRCVSHVSFPPLAQAAG